MPHRRVVAGSAERLARPRPSIPKASEIEDSEPPTKKGRWSDEVEKQLKRKAVMIVRRLESAKEQRAEVERQDIEDEKSEFETDAADEAGLRRRGLSLAAMSVVQVIAE